MYMYFTPHLRILIISLTTILNLPINSLCLLDTALVLPSDSFHSISPPSLPLLLSSHSFPWWLLLETVMWLHLYSVFTYIYSLLIEKDHMRVKMYQLNFHVLWLRKSSSFLPFLLVRFPGDSYSKLSWGAIFTVCSHTFILFYSERPL